MTIPSSNKIFGQRPSPLVRTVQNFFTAGFDSGQPIDVDKTFFSLIYTNVKIPNLSIVLLYRKMVRNVFLAGYEYEIMRNFIV